VCVSVNEQWLVGGEEERSCVCVCVCVCVEAWQAARRRTQRMLSGWACGTASLSRLRPPGEADNKRLLLRSFRRGGQITGAVD